MFRINAEMVGAHRVSYELYNGQIPEGMHVLHKCDVPLCVNPKHLFLGSNADNVRDKINKNRHTFGEKNGRAKLSKSDVNLIRELYALGVMTQVEIGKKFCIAQGNISKICSGSLWK
jgi:hypothetical protein